jgi:hypothetical protein
MWKNELWIVENHRICKHFRVKTVHMNTQFKILTNAKNLAKLQR